MRPRAASLRRIEPQPHRELALAEDDDVADARHALERVADVEVDVVADEQRVVAVVASRRTRAPPRNPVVFLVTVMPFVRTSAGMRPERLVDAVLHVDRGQVRVAADLEGRR